MLNLLRKIIGYDNLIRRAWHFKKGLLAAMLYGFPGKKMVCIGVTGTNGKTTTTHMIEHVLHSAGKKVAMMSTAEFSIDGKHWVNESKKTTLSPFQTQKFLKQCLKANMDYVVIESSSHALHQFRLWGIPFCVGVMTNLTHEHLDYHGNMQKYAAAKRMLFEIVAASSKKKMSKRMRQIAHQKTSVLNAGDEYYPLFKQVEVPVQVSYGIETGDLQAVDIENHKAGSKFALILKPSKLTQVIELKLTGSFNIENALAATGAALACDLEWDAIKKGLESFESVPGRMERIKSPKGFEVMVDFALTPDALQRLYSELKENTTGRLIGLIGSCGDRDKEKRPEMGKIVASHCDLTIVTDEEPYTENPMDIMQAILKGAEEVKTLGEDLLLIEDRKKAMEYAIKNAKKGDVIVVTGMGSFQTRTMNDGPMEWDEREVARELIGKYR